MTNFQIIGIITGFCSGLVWERLATAKFGHFYTLFPSVFVKEGNSTYHLHHWTLYALALIFIAIWAYKTGRLSHPAILFILSGLLGGILFDAISFKDFTLFVISKIKNKSKQVN